MDKLYVVTESEVRLFKQNVILYESCNQKNVVDDFLKGKKPVEEIASGKVQNHEHFEDLIVVGDDYDIFMMERYKKFGGLLSQHIGKNIKIYVEVKE